MYREVEGLIGNIMIMVSKWGWENVDEIWGFGNEIWIARDLDVGWLSIIWLLL